MPLGPWLMRQRLRSWLWATVSAGAFVGLLMWRGAEHVEPWKSLEYGTWPVAEIDEDAVHLTVGQAGRTHTIKLLGVEPIDPAACRAAIESLIGELPVRLSFDERAARAPGGELAACVYLPDGRMLNEVLLTGAMARPDATRPHALTRWFKRLSTRAKNAT